MAFNDSNAALTISWIPPLSYGTSKNEFPITYCISITNTISDIVALCGINVTVYKHYLYNFDPCVEYTVTVIPSNIFGNGTSAQIRFPGTFCQQ